MSRTRSILIVDDNPAVLAATARLLVQVGYEVQEAATGEDALRLIHVAANGEIARAPSSGVKHFLPKPYAAEAVLTVLGQAIEEDR